MKTKSKVGEKKFPMPKGKKAKLIYRSNEYLNAVWWDKNQVVFYLWDEVSKDVNHIIHFPIENL